MKSYLLLLCIISICSSCNISDNSEAEKRQMPTSPQKAVELNVSLNMTQPEFKLGMPVTLRFVLKNNNNNTPLTFCKLNSPANEMVWTNCFGGTDANKNKIPFIGNTPSYQGQVEEKDMMTIEPNGVKIYLVDLRTIYQLDKVGKYSFRFIGDKINLLPNSYPINFTIKPN
jgi:hypothetical protein